MERIESYVQHVQSLYNNTAIDSTDNEVQSSKDSRNRSSLHGIDKQSVEQSIGEIQTIQRTAETAED